MRKCKLHGVRLDLLLALDVTEESNEVGLGVRCIWRLGYVEMLEESVDFNFLPWDEYLFLFLFAAGSTTPRVKNDFARSLWMGIRDLEDGTWRFVLQLLDGQRRAPLKVAYRTSSIFEKVVANDKGEAEKEVVEFLMVATDGAGRTALQRASTTGDFYLVSRTGSWSHYTPFAGFIDDLPLLVRERWDT